jgi:hypothetical protein
MDAFSLWHLNWSSLDKYVEISKSNKAPILGQVLLGEGGKEDKPVCRRQEGGEGAGLKRCSIFLSCPPAGGFFFVKKKESKIRF